MSDSPTPGEWLRAALPGAFRQGVALLVVGAAVAALALAAMAVGLNVGAKGQAALACGALVTWGHGASWLVTGEAQRLDEGLTDLAGAAWLVFGAVWWLPVAAVWIVLGAVL
jgi:hypothetical protein